MLSGRQVLKIRQTRGLSQQQLAIAASVNKAYISEYETGIRPALPDEMMERIEQTLLDYQPAGYTTPTIQRLEGLSRLVLIDRGGKEFKPRVASVQWTEDDGTTYSIFLGDPAAQ